MKTKTTKPTGITYKTVAETWRALPKATVQAIAEVSGSDGHTIFKPEAYTAAGMPPELLAYFTQTFTSDTSDPKSTLFNAGGGMIPELKGVYGLRVVESIMSAFDLPESSAMGRGFRASHAFAKISAHCKGGAQ